MNNIKKHKRLIAAIVVILLAVLVEIFANRSAWGHAYDLDITDHMYISESAGQEEYQVIFSAPKGLYIQMLHVQGHFKDDAKQQKYQKNLQSRKQNIMTV